MSHTRSANLPHLADFGGRIVFAPPAAASSPFDALRGRVIVLEGVMGTGKSLLGRSIVHHLVARHIPARFYEEYVNKELLTMYLDNPERYAFTFQTIMVQKRIDRYIHEILPFVATGGVAVVDRFILGDISFEQAGYQRGHISKQEHSVYWDILTRLNTVPEPDYQVYLDCNPKEGLERIHLRGNESEIKSYRTNDLTTISEFHHKTFALCHTNVIVIDYNDRLYIKSDGHLRWKDVSRILSEIMAKRTSERTTSATQVESTG